MTVLDSILARKRDEVAALRRDCGLAALRRAAAAAPAPRGFARALEKAPVPRVIAEFKRASPSRGAIRADADAAEVARAYAAAGAAALSVLTDGLSFSGNLEDLRRARAACELPVLRKDFTLDEIQVTEARAAGADCVLLIVAALEPARLAELLEAARAHGLDALVEVHDARELDCARAAGAELVGINNRDLRTFTTDVQVTRDLLPRARGATVVCESGLRSPETVRELAAAGVHAFLVGEALMSAPDPGAALRALRGEA